MKLFEFLDTGGLYLQLKNYKDQADAKKAPLKMSFNAFRNRFNLDQYGLSSPELLKKWVEDEKQPERKKVIDPETIGTEVDFKQEEPIIPTSTKNSPSIDAMASQAARKELNQP